jgi:hypothetical protein
MPGVFAPADRRVVEPSHLIEDRLAFRMDSDGLWFSRSFPLPIS